MRFSDLAQFAIYVVLLVVLTKPLGAWMARVFNREPTFLDPLLRPVERLIYRVAGVDENAEMRWTAYALAVLLFHLVGIIVLYLIQRGQGLLPWNPQGLGAVLPDLAFNTSVSFNTNTNWQAYPGETTMSYFTQMAGLAVQNFVSAATGIAISIALIRAFARKTAQTIGNFWVDLVRCTLWVLLPLSTFLALALVSQGVVQTLGGYVSAKTLEGAAQTIAVGPVASQEAIKVLGTNGGGFFNANSAHPFENPNALTNMLEMLAIFSIGAGLTYTFGRMVGDTRQGWTLFVAMLLMFLAGLAVEYIAEQNPNRILRTASATNPVVNMEGKESRFGLAQSSLFVVVTTDASSGAVNTMHDSLTPLGGLVPMLNIALGEVIFGGVGSGLYGMLAFAIFAVFIAGLMVGRTPEYLGKKIDAREMKMATLAILISPALMLVGSAIAAVTVAGTSSLANRGPHGLSEMLYAFFSAAGNNGSAFAGLNANTLFYNVGLAINMFLGRFFVIIPLLAAAGSLAAKKKIPASPGTLPTHGVLFAGLLIGVILLISALTFFPALALGPVLEHLVMLAGRTF